jgi:hypothetical protein
MASTARDVLSGPYFGETFGRPIPEHLRWWDTVEENASMWATEDESRAEIVDTAWWESYRARVEQAARAAEPDRSDWHPAPLPFQP